MSLNIYSKIKKIFQGNQNIQKEFLNEEDLYFSNEMVIDEFSQKLISELALYKNITSYLEKIEISSKEIENLEHEAFNILIRSIEIEKNNSKVEVGVIGSFSSGKSTFINSLFQKNICPMSVKPTTSSITKFYYGAKAKITLNNKEITQEEYQHLSQHLEKNTKNTQTNYIEYAYPFEAFNSIVLYDTPGFNNNLNDNDTEVTMKTLKEVDVILFVVDIAKGDVDKSSMELLKTLQNKRIYCILNKSDAKSEVAVQKIKEEIISKKFFMEVIEYSALKVLEPKEDEKFLKTIQEMQEQFVSNKKEFSSTIKSSIHEKKGRRSSKTVYQLEIDNDSFMLDDFSHKAKVQREKVEKLLNNISQNKQFSLIQNLKKDKYKYETKALELLSDINKEIESLEKSELLLAFEADLDIFYDECVKFQTQNLESLHTEWNYAFVQSCIIKKVPNSEKSYWSTPYSKIYFNKEVFKEKMENIYFAIYFNNFMEKQINFFDEKWGWKFHTLDFKKSMYEEALLWYIDCYNSESYITVDDDMWYLEDENQAKKLVNAFHDYDEKEIITALSDFIKINEENIEKFKQILYSEDEKQTTNINELKILLNQFKG